MPVCSHKHRRVSRPPRKFESIPRSLCGRAELGKRVNEDRNDKALWKEFIESGEKLGFIVPMDEKVQSRV